MKTIYIIANIDVNTCNKSPWMNTTPFLQNDYSPGIGLQMISDLHWNCVAQRNETIYFSLYKIEINNYKEYLSKRKELFDSNNITEEYAYKLGFIKMNDFAYKVDPDNKKQMINGYEISISYHQINKYSNDFYLDCPSIYFD